MNDDVRSLLVRIKNDLTTNEIIKTYYDPLLDRDELSRALSAKKGDNDPKVKT